MERDELIEKLKEIKSTLKKDGFIIIGFFGSYARGENNEDSDIDLLYKIENPKAFSLKYNGFGAFLRLEEIKKEISKKLNKKIDLVAQNSLNSIGKKHILKDLINV